MQLKAKIIWCHSSLSLLFVCLENYDFVIILIAILFYSNYETFKLRDSIQSFYPLDTGRKLNVHKTFRRRLGRLLNVLCTFNLRTVSTGQDYCSFINVHECCKWSKSIKFFAKIINMVINFNHGTCYSKKYFFYILSMENLLITAVDGSIQLKKSDLCHYQLSWSYY